MHLTVDVADQFAVGGQRQLDLLAIAGDGAALHQPGLHQPLDVLGHGALQPARPGRQPDKTQRPRRECGKQMYRLRRQSADGTVQPVRTTRHHEIPLWVPVLGVVELVTHRTDQLVDVVDQTGLGFHGNHIAIPHHPSYIVSIETISAET
nr:hypothetical protein [Pseudomonas sp.]